MSVDAPPRSGAGVIIEPWREVFPTDPSIDIYLSSSGPPDIRLIPHRQRYQRSELTKLSDYTQATAEEKLALEADILNEQVLGMSALATSMLEDVGHLNPARPQWHQDLQDIVAALEPARILAAKCYTEINNIVKLAKQSKPSLTGAENEPKEDAGK